MGILYSSSAALVLNGDIDADNAQITPDAASELESDTVREGFIELATDIQTLKQSVIGAGSSWVTNDW